MVLTFTDAVSRHPAPSTWGPGDGRAWRRTLADDVEAGLAELWEHAVRVSLPESTRGLRSGAAAGEDSDDAPAPASVPGLALACVGSLARREAGPTSDLDLVLLTDGHIGDGDLGALTHELWYPLWDVGARLDHSVRTVAQCRTVASGDLAAALGLLDLRHVAGDPSLTETCAGVLLADWRRATRKRLGELADEVTGRTELAGELATLIEPDLKEARGGLRDVGLVRALAASSLADRPHGQFDDAVETLLDVRDALGLSAGRATNRLAMPTQDAAAQTLGLVGPDGRDEMLTWLYGAGRVVSAALDATMRTALRSARPARKVTTILVRGRRSAPVLTVLDDGVARLGDEVVLADSARPEDDPALPLRVARAAGRVGLPVAAVTRGSLARCPAPSSPWSQVPGSGPVPASAPARWGGGAADTETTGGRAGQARPGGVAVCRSGAPATRVSQDPLAGASALDLLFDLLDLGQPLVRVWEDLDLAGLPSRWWPGWEAVRNRPQRNPIHVWTVDRHMVRAVALLPVLLGREAATGDQAAEAAAEPLSGRLACHRSLAAPSGTPLLPPPQAVRLDLLGLPNLDAAHHRTLLLATLLHDLGKVAGAGDHAEEGALRVPVVLEVLGAVGPLAQDVVTLVRHHLLLADAAGRPPGDPGVVAAARQALGERPEMLAMLRVLTEADARAAGPRAWSPWRAGVVDQVTRALAEGLVGVRPARCAVVNGPPVRDGHPSPRCEGQPS